MKWTDEQQAAIDMRNGKILVAAGAGSGKTAVLVQRIINKIICRYIVIFVFRTVIRTVFQNIIGY